MSGDVQPRKRKDKKRKKDELGIEEPRGTAAILGEGDVFMHSQNEHGTGGHWCAKIIFFSLLAILITLIGLIILENRGLTELEANAVESRYSGVLQGWLEDSPDDDHHDEHTLDLKHHEDDDEIAQNENNLRNEFDQDTDLANDEEEHQSNEDNDDDDNEEDDTEEDNNINEDDDEDDGDSHEDDEDDENDNDDDNTSEENNALNGFDSINYKSHHKNDDSKEYETNYQRSDENSEDKDEQDKLEKYVNEEYYEGYNDDGDDDDNDNEQKINNIVEKNDEQSELSNYSIEKDQRDDEDLEFSENEDNKQNIGYIRRHIESDEDLVTGEQDSDIEIEKIEKEYSDEELDEPRTHLPVVTINKDFNKDEKLNENISEEDEDDEDFLSPEDIEELPVIEPITAPRGKPFIELEDETSSEKPPNTLAEEEEYEKQQAELSRQKQEASNKDGGNNVVDEWPGEPSETYWRQYLDQAEQDLQQGKWSAAEEKAGAAALRDSARARYVRARALDAAAEARRDNTLLSKAIAAYLELLKMNERLSDRRLKEIAERTLDRIRFRGNYMGAEPVYKLLINRFPDDPSYRNNLSISFLMANRPELAENVLRDTLQRWPQDRVALAHLGFVLKTRHNHLEEAVDLFQKALEDDTGPANEPRFYYHLGDALLLLGRYEEARRVHVRGAKLGHFLSPSQRSLYNVERLKSQPWWNLEETPYTKLVRSLEKSWKEILKEGNAAKSLYEKEKEGLKERGEWSQLDLFVRGQEIPNRCKRAPVTCSIVRQEAAAAGCRRGQIKFSMMEAGTHVRPHVGPTNCRLRMHLGLTNTKDTFIRVDQEIRQWQAGKVFIFDDSFEHEVWHNGTGTRLVLIVDVWHPDLTPAEKRQLPSI